MSNCVICGKAFPARRADAECCSANCRNKKKRLRDNQMKLSRSFSWDLEQYNDMQIISSISPTAAHYIEQIRVQAGPSMGDYAIKALLTGLEDFHKKTIRPNELGKVSFDASA